MKKTKAKKTNRFSVTCDAQLLQRMSRFAEKARRTPADATRYLIERGLEAENA